MNYMTKMKHKMTSLFSNSLGNIVLGNIVLGNIVLGSIVSTMVNYTNNMHVILHFIEVLLHWVITGVLLPWFLSVIRYLSDINLDAVDGVTTSVPPASVSPVSPSQNNSQDNSQDKRKAKRSKVSNGKSNGKLSKHSKAGRDKVLAGRVDQVVTKARTKIADIAKSATNKIAGLAKRSKATCKVVKNSKPKK